MMRVAYFSLGVVIAGWTGGLSQALAQGSGKIGIEPIPRAFFLDEPAAPDLVFPSTPGGLKGRGAFLLKLIGANDLGALTTGKGIRVGVIDTGVTWTHPDLYEAMDKNAGETPANEVDDDQNGRIDDWMGFNFTTGKSDYQDETDHGTKSAGLIASKAFGIAKDAKLLALRVTDKNGVGSVDGMVRAIRYAKERGVQIINISMGGASLTVPFETLIDELAKEDRVLVIASAGNWGDDCGEFKRYPASFRKPNLITVSATNFNARDKLALTPYSSYGLECADIAAPAGNKEALATTTIEYTGSHGLYHGTSAAAPVVSGVAALVWSACPKLKASQVKEILIGNAAQIPSLSAKVPAGRFIDAEPAVREALKRCSGL